MAWITPPVFVALQTLTDSVMNELSSRLSDLWTATTIGDTQYASATDALSRLAIGSAGQYYGVTGGLPAWKDDGVPGLFTTAGDLPYGTGANASARRAIGSTGQYLGVTGGLPVWKDDGIPGIFTTAGDLIYGTGANASARRGIGTAGQILTVNSGATAPEWATASFAGASFNRSTTQSISNGSYTYFSGNTENFDVGGYYDGGAPTRLTIPSGKGGYHLIIANTSWDTNATNIRETLITKNGSTIAEISNDGHDGVRTRTSVNIIDNGSATDYYEMRVWQNSGGALNIRAIETKLQIVKLPF